MAILTPTSPLTGLRRSHTPAATGGPPVSGAIIWLDAATPTTVGYADGASMTDWPDRSAGGTHTLTTISASQPVYHIGIQNGLGGVLFGGGAYPPSPITCVRKIFTLPQPITYFVAFELTIACLGMYIVDGGSTNGCACSVDTIGTPFIYSGGFVNSTRSIPVSTGMVATCVFDAANSYFGLASTAISSGEDGPGNAGTGPPGGISIGAAGDGSSVPYGGYVFEFLLYDSALSSGDRSATVSYLQTKWGI